MTRAGGASRMRGHRTIQHLARDTNVADWQHIGPHDIRHTAITGVLDATGGNIDKAQRFARHASPVTTQVYDHRNKKLDDHPSYALAAWFSEAVDQLRRLQKSLGDRVCGGTSSLRGSYRQHPRSTRARRACDHR